jgi:DNA-binding transcriptional LysR family regulator
MVFNDGEALAAAAVGGLGLVQLPTYQVAAHIAAGRLQPILEDYETSRGDIWLVWPPSRPDVPRVRVFAEFLTALLGN